MLVSDNTNYSTLLKWCHCHSPKGFVCCHIMLITMLSMQWIKMNITVHSYHELL